VDIEILSVLKSGGFDAPVIESVRCIISGGDRFEA
jgi:hypothetical protein